MMNQIKFVCSFRHRLKLLQFKTNIKRDFHGLNIQLLHQHYYQNRYWMLALVICYIMTQQKAGKTLLTFNLPNIILMEHFWAIFLSEHNSRFAKRNF